MNTLSRQNSVRKLALALWALATLTLCFVVVLLLNEMLRQGDDPLAFFHPNPNEQPGTATDARLTSSSLGTREIMLFFGSENGQSLAPEKVVIEYSPRTVENCRKALQALIAGPKLTALLPLTSDQTRIRALYLREQGELIIDLSSEFLMSPNYPRSAEMEALLVFGIVQTMTQELLAGDDEVGVKQVRFLFDGVAPQEGFPAHLDLSHPLTRDRRWVQASAE